MPQLGDRVLEFRWGSLRLPHGVGEVERDLALHQAFEQFERHMEQRFKLRKHTPATNPFQIERLQRWAAVRDGLVMWPWLILRKPDLAVSSSQLYEEVERIAEPPYYRTVLKPGLQSTRVLYDVKDGKAIRLAERDLWQYGSWFAAEYVHRFEVPLKEPIPA